MDQGSDISVIQEPYLKKFLPISEINKQKINTDSFELVSFSNTKITVMYQITLEISFSLIDQHITHTFYIINKIENSPPVLLGADFMRKTLMTLAYTGQVNAPIPELTIIKPNRKTILSYYCTEEDTFSCQSKINILPKQCMTQKFYLHPASKCLKGDQILVSGDDHTNQLYITPSKNTVHLCKLTNKYFVFALVHNYSKNTFTGIFDGKYELIENHRCMPITKENLHKLSNISIIHDVMDFPQKTNPLCITIKDVREAKKRGQSVKSGY